MQCGVYVLHEVVIEVRINRREWGVGVGDTTATSGQCSHRRCVYTCI